VADGAAGALMPATACAICELIDPICMTCTCRRVPDRQVNGAGRR
jgi:hypothetical protein